MGRYTNYIFAGVLVVLATGFLVTVMARISQRELDNDYSLYIAPSVVRNEWGQLRHTPEFMCEATIRQWLEECK